MAAPFAIAPRLFALAQRVGFNTSVNIPTTRPVATWRSPGEAKPPTAPAYSQTRLPPRIVATSEVVTEELMGFTGPPNNDVVLRNQLGIGIGDAVDARLVDPTATAATADDPPSSLTSGVAATSMSGVPLVDLGNLVRAYRDRGGALESAVWLLGSDNVTGMKASGDGDEAFPNLQAEGGRLLGHRALASSAAGSIIAIVDVAKVVVADDGELRVLTSRHGTVEMATDATNSSTTPTPTQIVSLWQTNSVGVQMEKVCNWALVGGAIAWGEVDYLESVGSPA